MTQPDHAENTGDNLRRAAEVQQQARDGSADADAMNEQSAPVEGLPDFNT
ncbi:hypothetical protein C6A87_004795 [Mycobacterium sp. ITM-2016-00317]|nr:hypothetical protein [Mycobacterium sp. ITM-2016-00317]WNG88561.1 hypothetical protein C6A87_004795 [Mycobacterium sp. ITM-2016-00317]